MMRTGRILGRRAVEATVQAMAIPRAMSRVRRTHQALGNNPAKGRVQWMWSGKGRGRQHISKQYFCPGGLAPSERRHCVRAIRGTPGVDYSEPGLNTRHRDAYHPPFAVSPFLLVLPVSCFKWTLWRCGRLWLYVGMSSLGTHLHQDCNALGDIAKISPRVPSTCAQNALLSLLIIDIISRCQIYVAIDNPSLVPSVPCLTTCNYPWNYMRAADDVFHPENLQTNCCQCISHLYKFRDGIQVTWLFRYCDERQG